ncbi:MAG TPA: sugar nucleotide-binding protein [Vitreimonas sp.]|nr:sugar nucleotide-binding protein [Vitreimonas sp.]
MSKVLVTGASSYAGAKIYTDLQSHLEVVGTYYTHQLFPELIKLDLTKPSEVETVLTNIKPEVIVHVANHSSGSWCKKHPQETEQLNYQATQTLVDLANKLAAQLIYISSFAPLNTPPGTDIYADSKMNAEKYINQTSNNYVIVQPSEIYGWSPNTTNDRPFNRLLKNIHNHENGAYDNFWQFQPTYLKHLSEVIAAVITKKISGQTIPVAVHKKVTRYELAKDLFKAFDLQVEPIDENRGSNTFQDNLEKLNELHLPTYTYDQVIEEIIQEIKEHHGQ